MVYKRFLRTFAKAVAAAGTAEALQASQLYTKECIIKAPSANTGNVFIGDSTVAAANGFVLAPGEELDLAAMLTDPAEETVFDLNEIYADVAVNGESVVVIYLERSPV
jgi:hypothetical protein